MLLLIVEIITRNSTFTDKAVDAWFLKTKYHLSKRNECNTEGLEKAHYWAINLIRFESGAQFFFVRLELQIV